MAKRIIRGVRVATPRGIEPASVFVEDGRITFVAGYEDIPREAKAEELGKSVLMPGLIVADSETTEKRRIDALRGGITTVLGDGPARDENSELSQFLSSRWTTMRENDQSLELLVRQLVLEPAKEAGLAQSKGQIAAGFDADFVVWNPEYTVTGAQPPLYGLVRQVVVAGVTRVLEGTLT